jgi:hypothetical protein
MTIRLTGSRNQCPTCGELFNSVSAFDRHRRGSYQKRTRHCLTPEEMTAKGMTKNEGGFWVTEKRKPSAPLRHR